MIYSTSNLTPFTYAFDYLFLTGVGVGFLIERINQFDFNCRSVDIFYVHVIEKQKKRLISGRFLIPFRKKVSNKRNIYGYIMPTHVP